MPSVGQYQRYIAQGESKLEKLNKQLLETKNATLASQTKSEIKELKAKLKEHKANLKEAKATSSPKVKASNAAPKSKASKGKVVTGPTLDQFNALTTRVSELEATIAQTIPLFEKMIMDVKAMRENFQTTTSQS